MTSCSTLKRYLPRPLAQRLVAGAVLALLALALPAVPGHAQTSGTGMSGQAASPGDNLWADGFGAPNIPSNVRAIAVAPNGDVLVGGDFIDAGGDPTADHIARWDGTAWHGLGPGLSNTVRAIVVLPNGDVVAGGDFSAIGATSTGTRSLARWDGTAWRGYGYGISSGTVHSLALAPNGDLLVGGNFQDAGGNPNADRAARWDGAAWVSLGPGITSVVSTVYALAALPNGDVVAGGSFQDAGGNPAADRLARWDGSAWQAYGTGLTGDVLTLAVLPGGQLVAGGAFTRAGGTTASSYLARWDGATWQPFGAGLSGSVASLAVLPGGQLAVGGDFVNAGGNADADLIARWDGTAWQSFGPAAGVRTLALAVDGAGRVLAGGQRTGGDDSTEHLRRWSGTSWETLADRRQHGFGFTVRAVAVAANGDLLAGGNFVNAEGDPAISGIARWNGQRWLALGPGLNGTVNSIVVAPNGDIIVAGEFYDAGGNPNADWVARWDGNTWQALGSGTPTFTSALAIAANGDIYAGGVFASGNGFLSVFNGTSWRTITSTLSGPTLSAGGPVRSLVPAPGGGVYVGGGFLSVGPTAGTQYLARYNGTSWSSVGAALGSGGQTNVGVYALALAPNGDLLAGGNFVNAGGLSDADYVARLTGGSWQALGTGSRAPARALAVALTGDVYVGGDFSGTTAQPELSRVMRWDGTAWQPLGSGLDSQVNSLAVAPNGNVLAGGFFGNVGDHSKSSAYFALFQPNGPLAASAGRSRAQAQLYPNPARETATLALPAARTVRPAQLLNALGQVVRTVPVPAGAASISLDLRGLAPGHYLLRCATFSAHLLVQ